MRPRSGNGTVPLPKYVHAASRSGRLYFTYQKFRATPSAWPRIALPTDPLSHEFITRARQCEGLRASREGDRWHWSFLDAAGRTTELPDPKPADTFWAAIDKAEKEARDIVAGERKTFAALISAFKASDAFRLKEPGRKAGLAQSTREQYERHFKLIEATWRDDPVRDLTPVDAQAAIDSFTDTPSAGRMLRSVLSRVIGWGIPRGYSLTNPVEHTEKPEEDGTYDPWPPWAFELFMEFGRIDLQLPVYSALFTGQRVSDLVRMLRPVGAQMPIVAQKTGEIVPVQIHSEYAQIIRAQPSDHQMLHVRSDGEPWTYAGLKTAWQRQMNAPAGLYSTKRERDAAKAMLRFREHRIVFHGLRKNAVNMLLEVGCTEERVASIVGMSPAMVHHYSKKVRKFRLAREAMKQLEAGWSELRSEILGNARGGVV